METKRTVSFMMMITMLSFLSLLETRLAAKYEINPQRNVTIVNKLGPGIVLNLHCKSKNDDLGLHVLNYMSSFSWQFKSNLFVYNTLFYCHMSWHDTSVSFDVYRAKRDDSRCSSKCLWTITKAGAYSYDERHSKTDLLYTWTPH